jgi:hypothetical protein
MTDETTPENTDTVDATPETGNATTETPETAQDSYDFVLDKYRTEGRSNQDSANEQAKAYTELQKQFGSFTGAPDEYEINFDETAKELGLDSIDTSAPMFTELMDLGKELQLNNEGMDKVLNVIGRNAIAERQAHEQKQEESLQAELKSLTNGQERINQAMGFLSNNLSPEQLEAVQEMATTAAQFEGLEQIISMAKGTATAPESAAPSTTPSTQEVDSMRQELDANGNRRLATDPEFRKLYDQRMDAVHGTHPHKQIVG